MCIFPEKKNKISVRGFISVYFSYITKYLGVKFSHLHEMKEKMLVEDTKFPQCNI